MTKEITHDELVRTLVKPAADIISSLTAEKTDLWHAVTGIATEAGEILEAAISAEKLPLDRVNMVEELGDLEFYTRQLCQNKGIPVPIPTGGVVDDGSLLLAAAYLSTAAGTLLDLGKKEAIYNKEVALASYLGAIRDLAIDMAWIRTMLDISRQEVLEGNIAKLKVRYGKTYSDSAAQARADKQDG